MKIPLIKQPLGLIFKGWGVVLLVAGVSAVGVIAAFGSSALANEQEVYSQERKSGFDSFADSYTDVAAEDSTSTPSTVFDPTAGPVVEKLDNDDPRYGGIGDPNAQFARAAMSKYTTTHC